MKPTNKSPLPERGTKEAETLINLYLEASTSTVDGIAQSFNYSSWRSFMNAMRERYGVRRKDGMVDIVEEWTPTSHTIKMGRETLHSSRHNLPFIPVKVLNPPTNEPQIVIPPIEIKHYKPSKTKDPETMVLNLGCWHGGEITPTYNPDVFHTRVNTLFNSTMVVAESHRKSIAINDLVVFLLGDMVHGENPFQGAKIGSASVGAVQQVYEIVLPELLSLGFSLRENFRSVKFYCVWGNHGRVSKESPVTSNWDMALYKAFAGAKLPSGVEVYPPSTFNQIVDINNHRFFVYHGDQINVTNGIPYFSQTRKVMSWYMTYDGFDYAVQGHFHKDDILSISSKTTLFCNGSLVSDDPYPLEKLGVSTIPIQRCFGVHKKIGVTWTNRLVVDWNYVKGGKGGS